MVSGPIRKPAISRGELQTKKIHAADSARVGNPAGPGMYEIAQATPKGNGDVNLTGLIAASSATPGQQGRLSKRVAGSAFVRDMSPKTNRSRRHSCCRTSLNAAHIRLPRLQKKRPRAQGTRSAFNPTRAQSVSFFSTLLDAKARKVHVGAPGPGDTEAGAPMRGYEKTKLGTQSRLAGDVHCYATPTVMQAYVHAS